MARFTRRSKATMAALHRVGWSYPRIGELFGCHHTTVMYHVDPYFRARKEQRRLAKGAP